MSYPIALVIHLYSAVEATGLLTYHRIQVYRILNGKLVSNVCTHEKTTSLALLDSGYAFVIGRSDGHILMMKLLDNDSDDIGNTLHLNTLHLRCICVPVE